VLSPHQNAEQYHDIMITHRCFENVTQLKYVFWNDSNKSKFDSGGN
jgi:hypothetical protein